MTKVVVAPGAGNLWNRWLVYWHTEMIPHLRRNWLFWGGLVGAILLFNAFFTLAITVTESLPYRVFVVIKGDLNIKRGDYIAWRWAGGGPYKAGLSFVKQVRGIAGDTVTLEGRDFFVKCDDTSTARRRTRTGGARGCPWGRGGFGIEFVATRAERFARHAQACCHAVA